MHFGPFIYTTKAFWVPKNANLSFKVQVFENSLRANNKNANLWRRRRHGVFSL